MTQKSSNTLIRINLGLSLVLIGLVAYTIFQQEENKKMGYVDLRKVYNEFQLKNELEGKLEQFNDSRTAMVDSFEMQLGLNNNENIQKGTASRKQAKQEVLEKRKQKMLKKRREMAKRFNERIWNQLNTYVEQYGSAKGYDIIHGTRGEGGIMYADEAYDLTDQMVEYVNNQYKSK